MKTPKHEQTSKGVAERLLAAIDASRVSDKWMFWLGNWFTVAEIKTLATACLQTPDQPKKAKRTP